MAKGQQSQKMVKKPKKDTSPPKTVSPDAVRPTIVTVVPVPGCGHFVTWQAPDAVNAAMDAFLG